MFTRKNFIANCMAAVVVLHFQLENQWIPSSILTWMSWFIVIIQLYTSYKFHKATEFTVEERFAIGYCAPAYFVHVIYTWNAAPWLVVNLMRLAMVVMPTTVNCIDLYNQFKVYQKEVRNQHREL